MVSQTTPEWLAKDCIDVGLFTNNLDDMLAFWQREVGLAFDHMLPLGGGVRQHRHDFSGAVLKINHAKSTLPPKGRGGLLRLVITMPSVSSPRELNDPDGNRVFLAPLGYQGLSHWAIEIASPTKEQFTEFYCNALGLPLAEGYKDRVTCGRSHIIAVIDPDLVSEQNDREDLARLGYRYTTVQVHKVDSVHAGVVAAGGTEGRPPETLGRTARISFVRDPSGNWMELSQRASITGSLEPG